MNCYSTRNQALDIPIDQAILQGLAPDGGLYMPREIPKLSESFLSTLSRRSLPEIALEVSKLFFAQQISPNILEDLVFDAINFPAPLVQLDKNLYVLELFHGPTLAFKDFGARFMSRLMGYFNRNNDQELVILVATSGDTGGAVASGFYEVSGTKVVILYPKDRVSLLQEKQLTTLGKNIFAVEIAGSFDTCQSIVKNAFTDHDNKHINLTSANSINLARLIPQSFYYINAIKEFDQPESVSFIVPSGNFGNLSAGFMAKRMGMKMNSFIAATNVNNTVPEYLDTGHYEPRESISTISNAMDVGAPSNFPRLKILGGSTWNDLTSQLKGYSFNDENTKKAIKQAYRKYNYIMDPHTAVGYAAYLENNDFKNPHIILSTAHPSKFASTVETVLGKKIEIPERLACLKDLPKSNYFSCSTDYRDFRSILWSILS